MSIQAGVPDILPPEAAARLAKCLETHGWMQLNTLGPALGDVDSPYHENQNWSGYALVVGCPLCNFSFPIPVTEAQVTLLMKGPKR